MAAMFQCMTQLGFTVVIWQHSEFDWYCQLSGSGSNSLNSQRLPGQFSYSLGSVWCNWI